MRSSLVAPVSGLVVTNRSARVPSVLRRSESARRAGLAEADPTPDEIIGDRTGSHRRAEVTEPVAGSCQSSLPPRSPSVGSAVRAARRSRRAQPWRRWGDRRRARLSPGCRRGRWRPRPVRGLLIGVVGLLVVVAVNGPVARVVVGGSPRPRESRPARRWHPPPPGYRSARRSRRVGSLGRLGGLGGVGVSAARRSPQPPDPGGLRGSGGVGGRGGVARGRCGVLSPDRPPATKLLVASAAPATRNRATAAVPADRITVFLERIWGLPRAGATSLAGAASPLPRRLPAQRFQPSRTASRACRRRTAPGTWERPTPPQASASGAIGSASRMTSTGPIAAASSASPKASWSPTRTTAAASGWM